MIITIDGPSGTGKSSAARGLASALGFDYVDTGAMYRAFAYYCLKHKKDPIDLLPHFSLRIDNGSHKKYYIDDEEVTEIIRTEAVTKKSSEIAVIKEVREKVVSIQQKIGKEGNCVLEGRDLGTVVFPDATIKIFLTARPEIRARRRYLQVGKQTEEEILRAQQMRDLRDISRQISPLKPAADAWILDTSDLTLDEVIDQLLEYVRSVT